MPDDVLRGQPVSPGLAAGAVRLADVGAPGPAGQVRPERRRAELRRAMAALDAAEAELDALAARLREEGRIAESELIEVGALMVEDPTLRHGVRQLVMEGATASDAILAAAETSAAMLADLDDPDLAGRAVDVRSVGRRAARLARKGAQRGPVTPVPAAASDVVLIAADLGPADVAELGPDVRAVALAEGGVTAHAAIVARSRGLPMVVQCGDALFTLAEGQPVVVDGAAGTVELAPDAARVAAIMARPRPVVTADERALPNLTRDGQAIHVLANVAGVAEVDLALAAGAEGVGLLRTELAFLDATAWPTQEAHARMLRPILARLAGRVATVRLLDFGGDKMPPFLRQAPAAGAERGIRLLTPNALDEQLAAILDAGAETIPRLLIPMVRSPEDVQRVRQSLQVQSLSTGALHADGAEIPPLPHAEAYHGAPPLRGIPTGEGARGDAVGLQGSPWGATLPLGAMIETPEAVAAAAELAHVADFFSIGTNDLAHAVLGLDRATASGAPAYHPIVLRQIDAVVRAATVAAIPVAVCGEAASDPLVLPLLIGLGVRELSVGAARVASVRRWVRALDAGEARLAAERALAAPDLASVEAIVAPLHRALLAAEAGDDSGDGGLGISARGDDP